MGIETDLRQAARWVAAAAARATDPAFATPLQALQQAARELSSAWTGSWLPPLSNLYQRELRALAAPLRVAATAAPGPVPASLQRECRPFTVHEIRAAVFRRAGCRNDWDLQDAALTAAGLVVDARLSLQAALELAASQWPGETRLAEIAAAGQALAMPDQSALIESWRPEVSRRQCQQGRRVDAAPPHLEVLASLDEMMSPFHALRQIAALMRAAAGHMDALPSSRRPRPADGSALPRARRQVSASPWRDPRYGTP